MINLFEDDGSSIGDLTGLFIGTVDDGGRGLNSLLSFANIDLNIGDYVLAIGEFELLETEARYGIASTPDVPGDYIATFTGDRKSVV